MKVTLVDASLYTAPYDAALTRGLLSAGAQPMWMVRPTRAGDVQEIPAERSDPFFYRRVDGARWMPRALRPLVKGCAHVAGTVRMLWKIRRTRPDAVHVQWVVVPLVDAAAMALIRRWCPLVFTVHDTVAYNGQKLSWLQRFGHELAPRLAHQVVVHTQRARQALLDRGLPAERTNVIPHGPLALSVTVAPSAKRDPRWTVVLFGEIKPYKGADLLIEAVGTLPAALRSELRVVIAGRPRMDVEPLARRIAALGLRTQCELRLGRLTEDEMAALFAEADTFVFPYRQIDASGVYALVKPLGKWMIASRVGVFAEEEGFEARGTLVPPQDVPALAAALRHAIEARPRGKGVDYDESWCNIGRATVALYQKAKAEFDAQ